MAPSVRRVPAWIRIVTKIAIANAVFVLHPIVITGGKSYVKPAERGV